MFRNPPETMVAVINSADREPDAPGSGHQSSSSNFFFKLPGWPSSATRIVVLQASIPKTYYLIENGLNSITVKESNGLIDRYFSVDMASGNYNAVSFRALFAAALTSHSAASGFGLLYSITLPNRLREVETGKMTFRAQGPATATFITSDHSINEQLGLDPNKEYPFVAGFLTSGNVCNFNLHSQLFIRSDICQNVQDCILQDIYTVDSITSSYIVFTNMAPGLSSKKLDGEARLVPSPSAQIAPRSYHFWLTDGASRVINLHGIDMSFTVLIY